MRKKHLKRWPAYLMRFLPLTSPDIPLPFQRGLKMLIIFLCVLHGIELLKVRIRVCITKSEDVFARPSALVCNNKKRAPSSRCFQLSTVQRYGYFLAHERKFSCNTLVHKQIQVNTSPVQVSVQVWHKKREPTNADSLIFEYFSENYFNC